MMDQLALIHQYLEALKSTINHVSLQDLDKMFQTLSDARGRQGRLFLCGDKESILIASQIVRDLRINNQTNDESLWKYEYFDVSLSHQREDSGETEDISTTIKKDDIYHRFEHSRQCARCSQCYQRLSKKRGNSYRVFWI